MLVCLRVYVRAVACWCLCVSVSACVLASRVLASCVLECLCACVFVCLCLFVCLSVCLCSLACLLVCSPKHGSQPEHEARRLPGLGSRLPELRTGRNGWANPHFQTLAPETEFFWGKQKKESAHLATKATTPYKENVSN